MRYLAFVLTAFSLAAPVQAQWKRQSAATQASLRGLSVVDSNVVWASGTGGTYLWTKNGGAEWHVGTVPGATNFDFRGVRAISLDTVYLMVSGADTARIYKTTDRGAHWKLQYNDTRKGVFLDGIAFFDEEHGLAIGDPMDGHFFILKTDNGGIYWRQIGQPGIPSALPHEAEFAASNTALVIQGDSNAWFATGGGRNARVFSSRDAGETWTVAETPVAAGKEGSGIFSLFFTDPMHGIAVGGNYAAPDSSVVTVARTIDGGAIWTASPPSGATGYLSGVTVLPLSHGQRVIAIGTEGTSYSTDGGQHWTHLYNHPFNAVATDPKGRRLWAVGEGGVIAVMEVEKLGVGASSSR